MCIRDRLNSVSAHCTLSMENFISQTAKSCYYQLRRISSVRKYLSVEATVKLVTSLILSRLDYCNSLLSGLPASSVHSLRRIQNCAARLILRKRRTGNVIPLFQLLHWLPIQQRIPYKINTLCYKCITDTAPSYLCDCLQLYTPSRTLRTASDTLSLQRPRTRPHCWFPRLFCFWSINMEWPFPSSPTQTLSGLIQKQLKNFSLPKTVDLPCFLFRAASSAIKFSRFYWAFCPGG